MKNPFAKGNMTKMKMLLPVSKKEAWRLIATPKGLASWFPTRCKRRVQPGRTLEFQWPDGTVENHRVLSVGDANSSIILDCGILERRRSILPVGSRPTSRSR